MYKRAKFSMRATFHNTGCFRRPAPASSIAIHFFLSSRSGKLPVSKIAPRRRRHFLAAGRLYSHSVYYYVRFGHYRPH